MNIREKSSLILITTQSRKRNILAKLREIEKINFGNMLYIPARVIITKRDKTYKTKSNT